MPVKLVPPRPPSPNWTIRGTYLGVYVNRSAKTGKRAIAVKVLKGIERQIESGAFAVKGEQTFADAAAAYMKAGGERTYLKKLLEHFGDTPLREITQSDIDAAAVVLYPQGSGATRNRQVYTPVSAIARRMGFRLDLRRPDGSGGRHATSWLWPEQAEAIFQEAEKLNPEFATLLIVLCYTGMRLSEALGLTWEQVRLQDGFAYLAQTKNEEPRAIFLPPVAVATLGNLPKRSGRIFRFAKSGHLYSCLRAVAFRAEVDLPERSAFHIFRRTYATWMMRYAGLNTRQLVGTGAWKDAKMAARYAQTIVSEESMKAVLLPTPRRRA